MRKKTLTFRIKIPEFLYRFRWENIKKYASWLWRATRCSDCGKKMVYRHPEFNLRSETGVRRMMLTYNVVGEYKKALCPECLANSISDENAVSKSEKYPISEHDVRMMCDCCNQPKKSYKWVAFKHKDIKVGFITGREWWNGFYFCADCIKDTLLHGKQDSSIHVGYYKGDKYYSVPQNEFGLPVVDGKVRFPF